MARWKSRLLATLLAIVPIMGCGGITQKVQHSLSGGEVSPGSTSRTTQEIPRATRTTHQTARQSRLDIVKKRGKLICGVSGTLPGFSFVDSNGKYLV